MMYLKMGLVALLASTIIACGGGGESVEDPPGKAPTATVEPTSKPTSTPTSTPTIIPTTAPTIIPTIAPTATPTSIPGTPTVDGGFAGYNFNLNGGAEGNAFRVNTGVELQQLIDVAGSSDIPVTIYVDGTINPLNSEGDTIQIENIDNLSIIGLEDLGEFDGVGIRIHKSKNIIIQNLTIHEVTGSDAILIAGDNSGLSTGNIWIDHNELYGSLAVDENFYGSLVCSGNGAENITLSYNYIHDQWNGTFHGIDDNDVAGNRNITFHHNYFENIVARSPLIRYGNAHVYNNYYREIDSTAINSIMGARLLVENNIFEDTINPIISFYSQGIGYWNSNGNSFFNVNWTNPGVDEATAAPDGTTGSDASISVPYPYILDPIEDLKFHIVSNAGAGKIDQSSVEFPDLPPPGLSLPYYEGFAVVDELEFFSAAYHDINGASGSDANTPMYYRVRGSATIDAEELTITGARVSIGNSTPVIATRASDTTTTGVLDLRLPYQVKFKVVSVAGDTRKNFSIYVDNNTTGQENSIHGGDSKFYSVPLSSLTVGETLTVPGFSATSTSFITFRTESDATVTIDDLLIELVSP